MNRRTGVKFIVTAGPTREWLDPVRFISNPSTGRAGYFVAKRLAAGKRERAASEVVFIHGPLPEEKIKHPKKCRSIPVETTIEMLTAVARELIDDCVLIMAAAPADYRPTTVHDHKLKKGAPRQTLELVPNPDILNTIGEIALAEGKRVMRVGFAAETQDAENYGRAKLKDKGLSLIFINTVGRDTKGFGRGSNEYVALDDRGNRSVLGPASKKALGKSISEVIWEYLETVVK